MTVPAFSLSPAQMRVVAHRGGHLQVVACAGSGKTESIARRVASLIEAGTEPESIVAFSFTERAAAELKERIVLRVASALGDHATGGLALMFVGTDENVHRVRTLLDETFGPRNHIATITYKTAIGMASDSIDPVHDYLLWYSGDPARVKFRRLYHTLEVGGEGASRFKQVESRVSGLPRLMNEDERSAPDSLSTEWQPYRDQGLTSRSGSATTSFEIHFNARRFCPPSGGWRTSQVGMERVRGADRLMICR